MPPLANGTIMNPIAIEFISVFGLPPVEFVHLAADLGCHHIGTGLVPLPSNPPFNPHGYPAWSLREDAALRRAMRDAMRERDVRLAVGEGFLIRPDTRLQQLVPELEIMRELGAANVNVISIDPETSRAFDQMARLVELAHGLGMQTLLEFGPLMAVPDLATALAALRHVGQPHFRLLIDAMHWVRSGANVEDLAALDPALIGHAQLCDAPLVSQFPSYAEEAKFERMVPGTGELPLRALAAALPRDVVIGLEVPQRSLAEAGVGPHERLRRCVEAARQLLSETSRR